jgi:hypothetical protein
MEFNLVLISSHLHQVMPSGLCPSDSPTEILYAIHLPLFPLSQIRFDNHNSTMWGLQMMKICPFLRLVIPSLSDPNILFITLFSKAKILAKPLDCTITRRVVSEDKQRYQYIFSAVVGAKISEDITAWIPNVVVHLL